jgi:hypothetical protein
MTSRTSTRQRDETRLRYSRCDFPYHLSPAEGLRPFFASEDTTIVAKKRLERRTCKPLAELLTRENMSFTGECLCVITKAHPELTESFVGAADLCKDAAHRFRNNAKVSKI